MGFSWEHVKHSILKDPDFSRSEYSYHDIFLKPHPEHAPYIPMRELLTGLKKRVESGVCVKLINNESAAIRIIDLLEDPTRDLVVLLVQYTDKNLADPAFGNMETGALRVEPKLDGEGIAVSAHMLISLKPNDSYGNVYLTLLEKVPGITKSKIEPFLTSEFKEVCITHYDYRFKDLLDGKEKKYRSIVDMCDYASQTLAEDLERGELLGIELIKHNTVSEGMDEPDYTSEESTILKLKAKKRSSGTTAIQCVRRIMRKGKKHGFGNMKIKYKRREGKQISVDANTDRNDIENMVYTRCEIIQTIGKLPQCISKIDRGIQSSIISLAIKSRDSVTPRREIQYEGNQEAAQSLGLSEDTAQREGLV